MKQKATAVEIARSLGRRVGSVKAKARELRLVPFEDARAAKHWGRPKSIPVRGLSTSTDIPSLIWLNPSLFGGASARFPLRAP